VSGLALSDDALRGLYGETARRVVFGGGP
jgi:hypothetical protein